MSNPVVPPSMNVPPGRGGMPKWVIILIVVLLLVCVGCCGGLAMCRYVFVTVAKKGPSAMQKFVENQEKKQGVNVNFSGGSISLPANFPGDVPVYSGFSAMTSVTPPGEAGGSVTFKGSADPQKVVAYYQDQLKGKGWEQGETVNNAATASTQFTKGDQAVTITAEGDASSTILIINYGKK